MNDGLFDLSGRVALITGTSRGLGQYFARALARAGADIAMTSRNRASLKGFADEIEALGRKTVSVDLDVRDHANIQSAVAAVEEHFGRIDILVNNAGASWGAKAEEHPLEAWNKVMTLNASSVFALSQAVANKCFIPQRSGNIIVIASTAALRAGMQMKAVAYYSSKAAALHLTRALAGEWGQYNIRVNAICPGFFPSKMASVLLDSMKEDVIARTPLGRIGGDTDLQGAAVYLASDASRHVTGQYIAVDGGASST